ESMTPEFEDGDVIIVEPGAPVKDGSFVLALSQGQWTFRQLRRQGQGWWLCPLHCGFPSVELTDLGLIRGVVIQKSRPGRRSATRHDLA
ncbi:MAG TPA: S24 family peptidase, partial [Burkholderiaceae bacterium]|nr:S24 family peptidase [Burkholderiaceae bacterium]